jgi:hypothetical protein
MEGFLIRHSFSIELCHTDVSKNDEKSKDTIAIFKPLPAFFLIKEH